MIEFIEVAEFADVAFLTLAGVALALAGVAGVLLWREWLRGGVRRRG